ncbi:hypothetical protein C8R47DRAFT_1225657 [Mycena vitilis]|nr:hypothetical protein C8R47DRAFT_1225657 [Mycena vitilis]
MVFGDRIATEVWDGIVSFYSSKEDRQTLQHLNLTNRRFHLLSRPRLFADFAFHPYSVRADRYGMSAGHLILPTDPNPERLRQRLEFWASEGIAPYVRTCAVQPLEFEGVERVAPPDEDPYALLKRFYELLPRFVNLESLEAFTLHVTNLAIANLFRLPKLASLSIDMCVLAEGETPDLDPSPKLKLKTLTFANCDDLEEWCFHVGCPEALTALGLTAKRKTIDTSPFQRSIRAELGPSHNRCIITAERLSSRTAPWPAMAPRCMAVSPHFIREHLENIPCGDLGTIRRVPWNVSGSHNQEFFEDPSIPCFPNVVTLDLATGRPVAPRHVAFLSKFPGVKDVALRVMPDWHTNLRELEDTRFCPLLERYYGPCVVLPFLSFSAMTNLTVETCESDEFIANMRAIGSKCTKLWYAKLSFTGYLSSLRNITDLFSESEVKILRVAVGPRSWIGPPDDPQTAVSFFESLPSSLPEHITKLAIDWEFREPVDLPDMKKLKDDILAQRPSLKTLWIHCGQSAFVWAEMPDGTESIASGGSDFAAIIRGGFDIFFYGSWRSPAFEDESFDR